MNVDGSSVKKNYLATFTFDYRKYESSGSELCENEKNLGSTQGFDVQMYPDLAGIH